MSSARSRLETMREQPSQKYSRDRGSASGPRLQPAASSPPTTKSMLKGGDEVDPDEVRIGPSAS